jgi:hypothetical protein
LPPLAARSVAGATEKPQCRRSSTVFHRPRRRCSRREWRNQSQLTMRIYLTTVRSHLDLYISRSRRDRIDASYNST